MKLQIVNPSYVCQIWPKVETMLSKAMDVSQNEFNIHQLKLYLTEGRNTLIVAENDTGTIIGACAVQFEKHPNANICFITAIGGRMIARMDLFEMLCDWARSQGCTKIRGATSEAVGRLWRQKFNLTEVYRIMEKPL